MGVNTTPIHPKPDTWALQLGIRSNVRRVFPLNVFVGFGIFEYHRGKHIWT